MGVSLQQVISELPPESQKRVKEKTARLIIEYENLQAFRKSIGITQKQLARKLSINQVNISRLESRSDMHLSTLRKYVEALGCELEINIKVPDNTTAHVENIPNV